MPEGDTIFRAGGLLLRTHMRMNGSWHIYRPGETWQRPRRSMRIIVGTEDFVAVGFDSFDAAEARRRIRGRGASEIADVLLNQRVLAGIGNVYKSEVLFSCGVSPFAKVDSLKDDEIACLVSTARRFLEANVTDNLAPMTTYTGFRRTTRRSDPKERLWVCDARLTYWCSTCQPSRS